MICGTCNCHYPSVLLATSTRLQPSQGGGFKDFLFSLYLGKIPSLTTIFQGGWFHQLDLVLHGFMLTDRISFSAKPISFQLQRDPTMLDFFQVPKCKLPGFWRNPIPSMGLVYLPNLPTKSLYKNQTIKCIGKYYTRYMDPSWEISGYLTPVAMLLPTAKMCHSKVELKTLVHLRCCKIR